MIHGVGHPVIRINDETATAHTVTILLKFFFQFLPSRKMYKMASIFWQNDRMLEFGDFNTTYISVHEASCIVTYEHFTFKKQCRDKASILLEKCANVFGLEKKLWPFAQNWGMNSAIGRVLINDLNT